MKNLVIVESPSKAKTIGKYLGKDYKVIATVGHIIDLPKSKLGVDIEAGTYAPDFTTIKGKAIVIKKIKKELPEKKGKVYLAMDPDREGEAIAWHVAEALGLEKADRIVFHEITKKAVNEAINKPRKIDQNLVQAQIARRVLDRLVGYKVSEVLWKKIWYGLSAGRVQSVALKLIVEREKEIEAFIPEEFWKVAAEISNNSSKLIANLVRKDGKKFVPINKDQYEEVKSDIENQGVTVKEVKVRKVSKHAYAPFTTSTLQQSANNIFGYSAKRTMGIAQILYQDGHITYMRTDSTNLSADAISAMRSHIMEELGDKYLPKEPNFYKTKSKSAQEAHEAIRPTDVSVTKEVIQQKYGEAEAKLYDLIRRRALASQMANRESEILSIILTVKGVSGSTFELTLGGERVLFDGFRKILGGTEGKSEESLQEIESLKEGDQFNLDKLNGEQNFTKPKARYTDASLVKALEQYGVGRPSTYATIISTVESRGYVEKRARFLHPLDVGRVVSDFLDKNFHRLVDYNYTAGVEDGLDKIAEGTAEYVPFIDNEFKPLLGEMAKADKDVNKEDVVILGDSEEKCEKCGADMIIRLGRFGKFLSCTKFPECKGMKAIDGGADSLDYEKYMRPEKCPTCGKELMLKNGRYGQFWACSDYPNCKGVVPLLLNEKCPECEKPLVQRKGRWGKHFTGCSGYPDCKYIKKEPKKQKEEE